MERFTKKLDKPIPFDEDCTVYYAVPKNHDEVHVATNMANKLGRLEDIEEKIGCSLEVIGKMIIEGCFYDGEKYKDINIGYVFDENEEGFVISVSEWKNGHTMFLKDYKKTWWIEDDKSE